MTVMTETRSVLDGDVGLDATTMEGLETCFQNLVGQLLFSARFVFAEGAKVGVPSSVQDASVRHRRYLRIR